ncbi:HypC/HybG/HupF family hydrogenase formation chaperone [Streptacidiphilus anmyonensis]|uniref:HypC/HybG/HupF family hydrogenase formation chaperone n=1 Tax=Streptacidiphilus anmyonensis TaxID=405782 RepID=UPI0005AB410F|nr:HypC/HybG/HupF family hydrogenase formation chaperone [Streptacidiphilus anmyonensis]
MSGTPYGRGASPTLLAVPGRITEIRDDAELRMAQVDFAGVVREICLACVPQAEVGGRVVVHLGFAVSVVHEAEAQRTLGLLRAMDAVREAESRAADATDQGRP